jgi:prophage antirepressor-like protein|nr:MAG TPA: antirepressor [Bacteriophage sp.]DAO69506.1 MAG TPA: antirepressor [Bacteriophage sp.]
MSYNYPTTKDSSHNEIKAPMNTKNICGVDCYEQNGVAYLRLENVARGLGFTTVAASGNEVVRWNTVYNYLTDLKVVAGSCNGNYKGNCPDFIPENIFYRLAMKAKNETAEKFQALVADEIIPSIRKNGIYATDNVIDEILNNPDFGIELLTKLKQERQARVEAERKNAILTHVNKTYTMTEIAKELNLKSAIQLNKLLADKKIQYSVNGTWVLYSPYSSMGYEEIKQEILDNGKVIYHRRITQLGREFILQLFNEVA